jgi:hypothetical protein
LLYTNEVVQEWTEMIELLWKKQLTLLAFICRRRLSRQDNKSMSVTLECKQHERKAFAIFVHVVFLVS